jgi:hypothetical protein
MDDNCLGRVSVLYIPHTSLYANIQGGEQSLCKTNITLRLSIRLLMNDNHCFSQYLANHDQDSDVAHIQSKLEPLDIDGSCYTMKFL